MNKNDYLLASIREKAYIKRAWLYRVFGVALDEEHRANDVDKPWTLLRTATSIQVVMPDGSRQDITDAEHGVPLFKPYEVVFVPPNTLEHWAEGGFTTAGNLLYNACAIWPIFGSEWGILNTKIDQKKIEAKFAKMQDDPEEGSARPAGVIYVSDWIKYTKAMRYLEELSPLIVTTLSERAIIPNKEVEKLKLALLEKHKHELDDPVVQARIYKELEDMDAKTLANEPGKVFLETGKSKLIRRKLTIMVGAEQGLDVSRKPAMITNSLHDGFSIDNLQDVMNISRAGSFDRGYETMNGGLEAKDGERSAAGGDVSGEDCGTTRGYTFTVSPNNAHNLVNRYTVDGTKAFKDIAEVGPYMGQTITVRSPNRCKGGPGILWCKKCLGLGLGNNPRTIPGTVSAYGSGFLQLFLQSMHAKAPVVVRLNVRGLMS